jgi:hypothetical protein
MEEYNSDFVVDITGFTDKKIESFWLTVLNFTIQHQEPESPISTKTF